MTKKLLLVYLLIILLIAAGCSAGRSDMNNGDGDYWNEAPGEPAAPPMEDSDRENPIGGEGSFGDSGQKIIYTVNLNLDVEDVPAAADAVERIAREAGGYVAQSNIYGTEDKRSADFTLRVPAGSMDNILDDIQTLGKVTQNRSDSDNVTMPYIDLEARIRNLERHEERLLDIMDKAETVEDLMRVEQELARVRGDLEVRTAEFRYLRDRVNYATVHVSMKETPTASTTVTGSGLKGVWERGINGLVNSINSLLTGIGSFLVFLFAALPYLLLIAIIFIPVYLIARKRNANQTGHDD